MSILVGGFGQRSSFPGWLVINCFLVFFFYEIFFFPFFETLNGTRRLPLGKSREIPPLFCCWNWNPCFVGKGSLLVKFEPSSFTSSPRLRKISGLAVPPSIPFFCSNRHPVLWLTHQPLVIQNERLTPTVLENCLPPPWTACFKLKQGNMCQQVSPNHSSSRLWDRICKYNKRLPRPQFICMKRLAINANGNTITSSAGELNPTGAGEYIYICVCVCVPVV